MLNFIVGVVIGYIGAHLFGKYEDKLKAVIMDAFNKIKNRSNNKEDKENDKNV